MVDQYFLPDKARHVYCLLLSPKSQHYPSIHPFLLLQPRVFHSHSVRFLPCNPITPTPAVCPQFIASPTVNSSRISLSLFVFLPQSSSSEPKGHNLPESFIISRRSSSLAWLSFSPLSFSVKPHRIYPLTGHFRPLTQLFRLRTKIQLTPLVPSPFLTFQLKSISS